MALCRAAVAPTTAIFPQVGLDNPAELKAAKLARSVTRGLIDKDLKPNSDERRRINAVLQLPPNKPLAQEAKALLWRFR
jgi:phosphatidylinositol 3-kinase